MVARVACVVGLLLLVGCECGVKPSDDAGVMDSGLDAGRPDAGQLDSGLPDAGEPDAGDPDAGEVDAGIVDAGEPDAGPPDAGPIDAGTCADFGCSSGVCCEAACVDTMTSNAHCGGCNQPCMPAAGATAQCTSGTCMRACETGFFDCDGDMSNGCESTTTCLCTPGMTRSCYSGPAATAGVGVCRNGTETCAATGLSYGSCMGEVTPAASETCGDNLDNDCNGVRDDSLDQDGDGYTVCDGDCCDGIACPNNVNINPGSFDVPGNSVDDDCDGTADGTPASCDTVAVNSLSGLDAARAMGLCQMTTPQTRGWGVLSGVYTRVGGANSGLVNSSAHAVRPSFGTANVALEGSRLLVLSTGKAAVASDSSGDPSQSTNHSLTSVLPADWLAAHGGVIPTGSVSCPPINNGSTAYDPVMLQLSIRVPLNAKSFSLKANYLSGDYAEYVCSPYVDQFLVLLDSIYTAQGGSAPNPSDKNLAVDSANLVTPLRTRFTQCVNGTVGCANGGSPSNYTACTGTAGLAGTGFDTSDVNQCDVNSLRGGGTGWMTIRGNVVPGETITLRIALWDSADGMIDSVVLLDQFEWSPVNIQPGG